MKKQQSPSNAELMDKVASNAETRNGKSLGKIKKTVDKVSSQKQPENISAQASQKQSTVRIRSTHDWSAWDDSVIRVENPSDLPGDIAACIPKWIEEALTRRPLWYVKYSYLVFKYQGKGYHITPSILGPEVNGEQFDSISSIIEDDLEKCGCVEIFYAGMID